MPEEAFNYIFSKLKDPASNFIVELSLCNQNFDDEVLHIIIDILKENPSIKALHLGFFKQIQFLASKKPQIFQSFAFFYQNSSSF